MNQKPELQVACGPVVLEHFQTPTAADCFSVAKTFHGVRVELNKIPKELTTYVIWPRRWETIRELMLAGF